MKMLQKLSINGLYGGLVMLCALSIIGCEKRSDLGEPRVNVLAADEVYEIGVNAYLWRGALETLSFMPMLSAEPNSGVIISDWKINPADANERTKVDVYIVGKELRADSLNVTVHREMLQNGNWTTAEPRANAAAQIIQAVTIQARLLRRDNAPITSY